MPTLMIILYRQNSDIGHFNTFAAKAIELLSPHITVGILAVHRDNVREMTDEDWKKVMSANNTLYTDFSNYLRINIISLCFTDDFPFENPGTVNTS